MTILLYKLFEKSKPKPDKSSKENKKGWEKSNKKEENRDREEGE